MLVALDALDPDAHQPVERSPEPHRVCDVAGAGLEARGRRLVARALERDVLDHVAAALPRRHRVEQLLTAEDGADAGGGEDLVPGEHEEVTPQRLHVDRHVRDRLRPVEQHERAVAMRHVDHLLRGHDGAERVGDLGHRHDARLRTEELLVLLEDDLPAVVDRRDAQVRTLLGAEHLPRYDVGVVLQPGEHHLVAGFDVAPTPALRDQIDPLRRAADEDDLALRGCLDEPANRLARRLVGVRRAGGQGVRGTVHVRILALVELRQAIDDGLRLLRRRRVVEPHEPLAADGLRQDGELALEHVGVERRAAALRAQRANGGVSVQARSSKLRSVNVSGFSRASGGVAGAPAGAGGAMPMAVKSSGTENGVDGLPTGSVDTGDIAGTEDAPKSSFAIWAITWVSDAGSEDGSVGPPGTCSASGRRSRGRRCRARERRARRITCSHGSGRAARPRARRARRGSAPRPRSRARSSTRRRPAG